MRHFCPNCKRPLVDPICVCGFSVKGENMNSIISNDATYTYDEDTNTIDLRGTDIKELGDILADALLLIPSKDYGFGRVSKGAYIQAEEIYTEIIEIIDIKRPLIITGHSLGGGIAQILALMIHFFFFHKGISIKCRGSIKVLSSLARKTLGNAENIDVVEYDVRYRDIVPTLGWWKEPIHSSHRTGRKKRHPFDFSLKEHVMY